MTFKEPRTPLAERFAAALLESSQSRSRVQLEDYIAAFLRAEPALATSPTRRTRLADAIRELAEANVLAPSRAQDYAEAPPLPRFVTLVDRSSDPPVGHEAAQYAWRPELSWAARLPLRRSEFDALKQIQAFLRDSAGEAAVVPTGERSLELFGDEKRLDTLRRNQRLFAPERLSLELLRAEAFAPPFAYRHVGPGPVALVLENVATFHSVLATLPSRTPVGLVVFGAGGGFSASVCYLQELAAEGPAAAVREIRYFGDLDRRGLEIPAAADAAAQEAGLPPVRPAVGLWAKLLENGYRAPHKSIDPSTADRLVHWLPATLRSAARDVLISGARLAQEAVGTTRLRQDPIWATWAGLGPPGVERPCDPSAELRRPAVLVSRGSDAPEGEAALRLTDAGVECVPDTEVEWASWVSAGRTRNWVLGDPLLDWLDLYGSRAGFQRDDGHSGYDLRTDFMRFVLKKGVEFEQCLMDLLESMFEIARIGETGEDSRSLDKARETLEAMSSGVPVVAQAVLRNPCRRTYGVVDLLVRSDLIAAHFPELLSQAEAAHPAPGLGIKGFHYRPVDIKYHTFELSVDGHIAASPSQLAYACQVWLYAEALGRVQGYLPPAAYLLGRSWKQGDYRGEGCLERLARVDLDRWLPGREATIRDIAANSVEWVRLLRSEGASWQVLPEPSVPELYPHVRNGFDAPWRTAKRQIAYAIDELTLLPAMNPRRRAEAHARGFRSWRAAGVSAETLGVTSPAHAARLNAVLAANRAEQPTVVPSRIQVGPEWRDQAVCEFFVDFETVSNVDDDFANLPKVGGQPLMVQIGCGGESADGEWTFTQWTVEALTTAEEQRIIDAWIDHMTLSCARAGKGLTQSRIYHWSAAEPSSFESAYNAARARHPDAEWPTRLPWFDMLEEVIRAEPVAVTGAFDFGLKSIAKAMHRAGLISTNWAEGPVDGLGAMVGIWSAAREAAEEGTPLSEHALVADIARYNEVDCRVLWEITSWLRNHR